MRVFPPLPSEKLAYIPWHLTCPFVKIQRIYRAGVYPWLSNL
jgi:hypothetical protein